MHPFSKSILSAAVDGGRVVVSYKLGLADGITLYSRRDGEADFSPLAEDEPGPFIDDRPKLNPHQPETRRYRAVLLYSGEENRLMSNEVELTLP
ncbi:MAG: hypothetical protein ACKV19_20760 [Verrucomicrobiales bacterium]